MHRKLGSGRAVNDRRSHAWTLDSRHKAIDEADAGSSPVDFGTRSTTERGPESLFPRLVPLSSGAEKKKLLRLGRCLREEDSLNKH